MQYAAKLHTDTILNDCSSYEEHVLDIERT